jgi:hypothetical protein
MTWDPKLELFTGGLPPTKEAQELALAAVRERAAERSQTAAFLREMVGNSVRDRSAIVAQRARRAA